MNEEIEVCKAAICSSEETAEIYSNPIVQFILGAFTDFLPGAVFFYTSPEYHRLREKIYKEKG